MLYTPPKGVILSLAAIKKGASKLLGLSPTQLEPLSEKGGYISLYFNDQLNLGVSNFTSNKSVLTLVSNSGQEFTFKRGLAKKIVSGRLSVKDIYLTDDGGYQVAIQKGNAFSVRSFSARGKRVKAGQIMSENRFALYSESASNTSQAVYAESTGAPTQDQAADLLTYSLGFYDAQKSGTLSTLPTENNFGNFYNYEFVQSSYVADGLSVGSKLYWRDDDGELGIVPSDDYALKDANGNFVQTDLSGGYYDAGDYVKYGLPAAVAFTQLGAGAIASMDRLKNKSTTIQYNDVDGVLQSSTLTYAEYVLNHLENYGDWLLKANQLDQNGNGYFVVQVGDTTADHANWAGVNDPETQALIRPSFVVGYDANIGLNAPGSDVAGAASAALSTLVSAKVAFGTYDLTKITSYLDSAKSLFTFAINHPGQYDTWIGDQVRPDGENQITGAIQNYDIYDSHSYYDDLIVAALSLYNAEKALGFDGVDDVSGVSYLDYGLGLTGYWKNGKATEWDPASNPLPGGNDGLQKGNDDDKALPMWLWSGGTWTWDYQNHYAAMLGYDILKSDSSANKTWSQPWDYGSAASLNMEAQMASWMNTWVTGANPGTSNGVSYTDGGLPMVTGEEAWGTVRYANTQAFLTDFMNKKYDLSAFSTDTQSFVPLGSGSYQGFVDNVIGYTLGANPQGQSMVILPVGQEPDGITNVFNPHHRNSSGFDYGNNGVESSPPNNVYQLVGALVGGPTEGPYLNNGVLIPGVDSSYSDQRTNYQSNEVALDYNSGYTALLMGLIQRFLNERTAIWTRSQPNSRAQPAQTHSYLYPFRGRDSSPRTSALLNS